MAGCAESWQAARGQAGFHSKGHRRQLLQVTHLGRRLGVDTGVCLLQYFVPVTWLRHTWSSLQPHKAADLGGAQGFGGSLTWSQPGRRGFLRDSTPVRGTESPSWL